MKINDIGKKLIDSLGIPKLLLVLAAGIVLIALSAGDMSTRKKDTLKEVENTTDTESDTKDEYTKKLERQFESVLANVSGVGRVKAVSYTHLDVYKRQGLRCCRIRTKAP